MLTQKRMLNDKLLIMWRQSTDKSNNIFKLIARLIFLSKDIKADRLIFIIQYTLT